jgi:thioredoxin-related protein
MKLLLVSLLTFFLHTQTPWLTDLTEAQKQAKTSHKYILLTFSGSDWCAPCIRLHKEIFDAEAFLGFAAQNLVLVNADFPRLKKNQLSKEQTVRNEALAEKYNPKGIFPLTLLLNAEGKVVRTWEGKPSGTAASFIADVNKSIHEQP